MEFAEPRSQRDVGPGHMNKYDMPASVHSTEAEKDVVPAVRSGAPPREVPESTRLWATGTVWAEDAVFPCPAAALLIKKIKLQ